MDRRRVGCRFRGGLGNQLFTLATTLAYGWRHDLDIVLSRRQRTTAANPTVAGRNSVLWLFPSVPTTRRRVRSNLSTRRDRWELHEHQPIGPPFDGADVVLDGLFGHAAYFDDFRQRLQALFRPTDARIRRLDRDHASMFDGPTVSVSVRRGDYLKQSTLRRYDQDPEWYRRALEAVPADARTLVFSDDLAWCRENFDLGRPVTFVTSGSPLGDLHLIGRCTHHVIPNSTFPWWAAWLDPDPGVVVQPRRWFTEEFVERLGRDPVAHDPGGWISL